MIAGQTVTLTLPSPSEHTLHETSFKGMSEEASGSWKNTCGGRAGTEEPMISRKDDAMNSTSR